MSAGRFIRTADDRGMGGRLASGIAWLCVTAVATTVAANDDREPVRPDSVPPGDLPLVSMVPAFRYLEFERPLFITYAATDATRLFVVEQDGFIRVFPNRPDAREAKVFLDLSHKVFHYDNGGHNEEGLLALAFHPRYEENGRFYVYYSMDKSNGKPRRGVLSRFRVDRDDPDAADPASETILLEVEQPYGNHNGCTLLFGPDGYLYVSLGDGGSANDPHRHGQNLGTLLGTILRIDVNRTEGDLPYGIPRDNPFVDRPGARGEIWAYGLRNVWRMSFDRETGELWAADVGQDLWEEIDLITKGGNYGWDLREGFHHFKDGEAEDELIDPVIEYGRDEGMSVTGGYVYRGRRLKRLYGAYVYGDYVSGRIWALRHEGGRVVASREILNQPKNIASFGEGPDGELYVCCFDGRIYRFEER